jgi:hypothetical protein
VIVGERTRTCSLNILGRGKQCVWGLPSAPRSRLHTYCTISAIRQSLRAMAKEYGLGSRATSEQIIRFNFHPRFHLNPHLPCPLPKCPTKSPVRRLTACRLSRPLDFPPPDISLAAFGRKEIEIAEVSAFFRVGHRMLNTASFFIE